ncbi:MAG: hypothetical protein KDC87_07750 [Planctomycetes bacterium]|nr:hypothetical protein [Planctomycetota bacterium]
MSNVVNSRKIAADRENGGAHPGAEHRYRRVAPPEDTATDPARVHGLGHG